MPPRSVSWTRCCPAPAASATRAQADESGTRQKMRQKLRQAELDEREIDIEVSMAAMGVEIMAPPGMEEMTSQLQSLFQNIGGGRTRKRRLRVRDAMKLLCDEESAKLIDEENLKLRAIDSVEQNGIVFIDEIDKVAKRFEHGGPDVSREGVQRDLLPLVEGCTVSTKYGTLRTDHILFIASGAFHLSKPSDLIPELQGRLPIRVELDPLSVEDFVRILTEPDASLTEQYSALLAIGGRDARLQRGRHTPRRRDRLGGQRAHGEHRRAAAAYGDGAAARDHLLRRPGQLGPDAADRRRVRR